MTILTDPNKAIEALEERRQRSYWFTVTSKGVNGDDLLVSKSCQEVSFQVRPDEISPEIIITIQRDSEHAETATCECVGALFDIQEDTVVVRRSNHGDLLLEFWHENQKEEDQ